MKSKVLLSILSLGAVLSLVAGAYIVMSNHDTLVYLPYKDIPFLMEDTMKDSAEKNLVQFRNDALPTVKVKRQLGKSRNTTIPNKTNDTITAVHYLNASELQLAIRLKGLPKNQLIRVFCDDMGYYINTKTNAQHVISFQKKPKAIHPKQTIQLTIFTITNGSEQPYLSFPVNIYTTFGQPIEPMKHLYEYFLDWSTKKAMGLRKGQEKDAVAIITKNIKNLEDKDGRVGTSGLNVIANFNLPIVPDKSVFINTYQLKPEKLANILNTKDNVSLSCFGASFSSKIALSSLGVNITPVQFGYALSCKIVNERKPHSKFGCNPYYTNAIKILSRGKFIEDGKNYHTHVSTEYESKIYEPLFSVRSNNQEVKILGLSYEDYFHTVFDTSRPTSNFTNSNECRNTPPKCSPTHRFPISIHSYIDRNGSTDKSSNELKKLKILNKLIEIGFFSEDELMDINATILKDNSLYLTSPDKLIHIESHRSKKEAESNFRSFISEFNSEFLSEELPLIKDNNFFNMIGTYTIQTYPEIPFSFTNPDFFEEIIKILEN